MEIWKTIPGYTGYEISSHGRLKSVYKFASRILIQQKNESGYFIIKLRNDIGERHHLKIHRLVAIAFIYNEMGKPHVNHINGIKTDNRVENLEWVTMSENIRHAYKTGLRRIKLKSNDINDIYHSKERLKPLSLKYGVSISLISHIKNKKFLSSHIIE